MKRLAAVAAVGLALAAVFAAQAFEDPEPEPVVPIELREPTTSGDETATTPQSRKNERGTQTGQQRQAVRPSQTTRPLSRDDTGDDDTMGAPRSPPAQPPDVDDDAGEQSPLAEPPDVDDDAGEPSPRAEPPDVEDDAGEPSPPAEPPDVDDARDEPEAGDEDHETERDD